MVVGVRPILGLTLTTVTGIIGPAGVCDVWAISVICREQPHPNLQRPEDQGPSRSVYALNKRLIAFWPCGHVQPSS
jgi:hypothetical protein